MSRIFSNSGFAFTCPGALKFTVIMKYYMQQHYYKNSTKVRVYVAASQGGRKYMEDEYSIVHHKCPPNQTNSKRAAVLKRPFMFFGIFDGHGGEMAAQYCRDNLYQNIIRQREFWSDDDKKICLAIHRGFVRTQRNMLNEVGKCTFPHLLDYFPTANFLSLLSRQMAQDLFGIAIYSWHNSLNRVHHKWQILHGTCR